MTDAEFGRSELDVRRYWNIVVSRWPVVLFGVGLCLLLASSYLFVVPRTYTASTTLTVFPITTDPYAANRNSNNLIDMRAEAATASSFKVAEIAVESVSSDWTASELRASTSVTPAVDSAVLTITVSAPSESAARVGAGAMAEAYLQARSDQVAASIDTVTARDRESIDDYREQLTDAIERFGKAETGSPAAAEASADQQILNAQISALLSRMNTLGGIDTTGGAILDPASAKPITVDPSVVLVVATGLAGGLIVGVMLAFITHSIRRPVRSTRDLRGEVEIEPLGHLVKDDGSGVAAVAERVLRLASVASARAITIVLEDAVPMPSSFVTQIASCMEASGTSVVVRPISEGPAPSVEGVVLIPVMPKASHAERLQALRTGDISIIVVASGRTKVRNLVPRPGCERHGVSDLGGGHRIRDVGPNHARRGRECWSGCIGR